MCSITPIPERISAQQTPTSKCPVSISNLASYLKPPSLQHFHQIDDDFPYDEQTPNTKTYFRPGALLALKFCSLFGKLHVYTAAQQTYTNNILKELDPDRTLFDQVIHRCDYPEIVKQGKDLTVGTDNLKRAILFDDRERNFKPQNYKNGIVVAPFNSDKVDKCHGGWGAYLVEVKEMSRLVGIAFWSSIHFSGDARNVVSWVRDGKD